MVVPSASRMTSRLWLANMARRPPSIEQAKAVNEADDAEQADPHSEIPHLLALDQGGNRRHQDGDLQQDHGNAERFAMALGIVALGFELFGGGLDVGLFL